MLANPAFRFDGSRDGNPPLDVVPDRLWYIVPEAVDKGSQYRARQEGNRPPQNRLESPWGRPQPPLLSQTQPSLRSLLLATRTSPPRSSSSRCCSSRRASGSRPRDCNDHQARLEGSPRRPWRARRSEVVQPQQRRARAASAEALRMPIANLRDETNNEEVPGSREPKRRARFYKPVAECCVCLRAT